jgi:hypothetical protein
MARYRGEGGGEAAAVMKGDPVLGRRGRALGKPGPWSDIEEKEEEEKPQLLGREKQFWKLERLHSGEARPMARYRGEGGGGRETQLLIREKQF